MSQPKSAHSRIESVVRKRKMFNVSFKKFSSGVQSPSRPIPAGYKTPRVQRALGELGDALDEAARLAGEIKAREAVPRRELQDQPVVDTLRDAIRDPALLQRLAHDVSRLMKEDHKTATSNGKA